MTDVVFNERTKLNRPEEYIAAHLAKSTWRALIVKFDRCADCPRNNRLPVTTILLGEVYVSFVEINPRSFFDRNFQIYIFTCKLLRDYALLAHKRLSHVYASDVTTHGKKS